MPCVPEHPQIVELRTQFQEKTRKRKGPHVLLCLVTIMKVILVLVPPSGARVVPAPPVPHVSAWLYLGTCSEEVSAFMHCLVKWSQGCIVVLAPALCLSPLFTSNWVLWSPEALSGYEHNSLSSTLRQRLQPHVKFVTSAGQLQC